VGVDEDRAGAAVGCDTVGWEGVVGDDVDYFSRARVEKAVARRAYALGSGERDFVWRQEPGEELGGGRISTGRTRGLLGVGWGRPSGLHYRRRKT